MRSPTRSLPGWSRFLEVYCGAVFLGYVLIILGHGSIPSLTDYANWTYQGVLLRDHLLGLPDAAHALKPYPVPNSAATVGIGLLSLWMSWQLAARLWLAAQLVFALASIRFFLRAIGADAGASILGAALFLNLNFWDGFINFQMGMSWLLVIAAVLVRRQQEPHTGRDWIVGVLLLLTFLTHMLPFAFAGLLVVLYCVELRRFRLLWQLVPSGLACLWYVAGRYLLGADAEGQAGMADPVRNYSPAFWAFKGNSYLKSLGFVNPTYAGKSALVAWVGKGGFVLLFGLNLALALAVAWCIFSVLRGSSFQRNKERFLWIGVVALLPFYLVAPGSFLGVSDPGSRLLQLSLVLGLLLCARLSSKSLVFAKGCALVFMTVDLVMFFRFAYGPEKPGQDGAPLPQAVVSLAHAFNHNQDYLVRALERGDRTKLVFPTGIFVNK